MPDHNQEQERLRRLRERQLADRDPSVKKREFQRSSIERERRAYKPESLRGIWAMIPHIWRGGFFGLLVGLGAVIAIPLYWISSWALPVAFVVLLFAVFMGIMIGRGLDSRDEIADNLRH